jgi:formate/nitrite transporter FocA (FNT family)
MSRRRDRAGAGGAREKMSDRTPERSRGKRRARTSSSGRLDAETPRQRVRADEERRFASVIVKRNEEARRHPDDILAHAIETGLEQLNRPTISLFLSAIVAGLTLCFTAMAVAVVGSLCAGSPLESWERVLTALVYPLGFVICIMSGAELYTEHTATAVYPVLDRRASHLQMLRLWVLVVAGNLTGALLGAGLLILADGVVGARQGYHHLAGQLVASPASDLIPSAVLAGILMALGAWLILATPPTLSQLASLYIVTFLIGLGGLHHSIAGAVEVFAGLLAGGSVSLSQSLRFIGLAILGNLFGGSLFVAGLNYAHIRRSQSLGEEDRGGPPP